MLRDPDMMFSVLTLKASIVTAANDISKKLFVCFFFVFFCFFFVVFFFGGGGGGGVGFVVFLGFFF